MTGSEQLRSMIQAAHAVVFFGGAGVSVPSGIPDFRSPDGLYNQKYAYPPEQIISHSFFVRQPELFFQFYRDKMLYPDAQPNAAHRKLAELERAGKLTAVITQNIDGLHQAAGSRNVLELHGSVHRNHCLSCGRAFSLAEVAQAQGVPHCDCGGVIKPDVVLYEESLDSAVLSAAVNAIASCDLLIVGGTSLSVYPAAGLIEYRQPGAKLAVINKSATPSDRAADLLLNGSIDEILGAVTL